MQNIIVKKPKEVRIINMKKLLILIIIAIFLIGCADSKIIEGKEYQPYGLFNKDEVKDDCISYRASVRAAVVGAIFFQTIVAPIIIFGFELWEPVEKTPKCTEPIPSTEFKEEKEDKYSDY